MVSNNRFVVDFFDFGFPVYYFLCKMNKNIKNAELSMVKEVYNRPLHPFGRLILHAIMLNINRDNELQL